MNKKRPTVSYKTMVTKRKCTKTQPSLHYNKKNKNKKTSYKRAVERALLVSRLLFGRCLQSLPLLLMLVGVCLVLRRVLVGGA